jgi:hypothetical protein
MHAALAAHQEQPPPSPSLPLEYILSTIDEPIRDSVRALVQPMVDELAASLRGQIEERDKQIFEEVWGRVEPLIPFVKAMGRVINTPVS